MFQWFEHRNVKSQERNAPQWTKILWIFGQIAYTEIWGETTGTWRFVFSKYCHMVHTCNEQTLKIAKWWWLLQTWRPRTRRKCWWHHWIQCELVLVRDFTRVIRYFQCNIISDDLTNYKWGSVILFHPFRNQIVDILDVHKFKDIYDCEEGCIMLKMRWYKGNFNTAELMVELKKLCNEDEDEQQQTQM